MNDPREIVGQLRRTHMATLEAWLDASRVGEARHHREVLVRLALLEAVRIRIEPTPTTENGPVIIDVPDTASARIGNSILAGIIDKALRNRTGITVNWRSDTCAAIDWR
jgi:hypothetical protein